MGYLHIKPKSYSDFTQIQRHQNYDLINTDFRASIKYDMALIPLLVIEITAIVETCLPGSYAYLIATHELVATRVTK